MAKLPGWEPSISTAMPRKSPALRGAPAMVRPAVQQFVPLDNPNDYLRLANAKADKYSAIGGAVSAAANVFANIADAEETAAAELAVSEYIEDRSANQAALDTSDFSATDQDGNEVYPWMDAVDEYDEYANKYQEDLLGSRKWNKKSQDLIKLKMSAADATFRNKAAGFVRDRTVDKAQADTVKDLDFAAKNNDLESIKRITQRARNNNTFGAKEAAELQIKYTERAAGESVSRDLNMLRQNAPAIPEAQFNAAYSAIMNRINDPSFEGSPGVAKQVRKQGVDLHNDYYGRIVKDRQLMATNMALLDRAKVVADGDPVAIQENTEQLGRPSAMAKYGPAGHTKVTEMVAQSIEFGVTSPQNLRALGNIQRDLGDLNMVEADALARVNQMLDEGAISEEDYRKAIVMIGTVQDPVVAKAKSEGKEIIWKNLTNNTEAQFLLFPEERLNEKRAERMRAQTAVQKFNRKLKAAVDGHGPIPDPTTLALQTVAESYYIEPFMVNSEGKKATDVWDIDNARSEAKIEEFYENELAGNALLKQAAKEREARISKLFNVMDVKNTIQRPDDEQ